MGIFDQVVSAINSPELLGNASQLGNIVNVVQQFSGSQGLDSATTQAAFSMVGNYVKSSLQEKQNTAGSGGVEGIVQQFAGTQANPAAVQALFSPAQQQQISQAIAQQTGLDANAVQSLLAIAVPVVLNLLHTGQGQTPGGNPVLNSFLDGDGDGDVDLGDALGLAGRFLGNQ